jgi:hypothetical protein
MKSHDVIWRPETRINGKKNFNEFFSFFLNFIIYRKLLFSSLINNSITYFTNLLYLKFAISITLCIKSMFPWRNLLNCGFYHTKKKFLPHMVCIQRPVPIFFWILVMILDVTSTSISIFNIQKKLDAKFNFTSKIHFFLDFKNFKFRLFSEKTFLKCARCFFIQ